MSPAWRSGTRGIGRALEDDDGRMSHRYTLGPAFSRGLKGSQVPASPRKGCSLGLPRRAQRAAWGVTPKPAPAGRKPDLRCTGDREIDAGEPGGGEPPRRVSGRRCGAHCARQCRTKCGRAPQERLHECRERCERRPRNAVRGKCAGNGAVADALMRSMVQRRVTRQRNATAIGGRSEPEHERGAKRPRGRRRRATDVRTRKRAAPPPPVAGDDGAARLCAAVRPRCAEPGCRAAAPCRRGSR